VWVAGVGAESGLARHARIHLARVRPSVHLISENTGTWAEELASTGPQDALSVVAIRPWPAVVDGILGFARTTRLETVVVTDPTNASRARRQGATPLICQVSMPGPGASHTTVLSMLHLVVNAVAGRLGALAERRRDLIMDLREELDPSD
jgi:DNA-binding MurR/RpiR family transcriptional regulator